MKYVLGFFIAFSVLAPTNCFAQTPIPIPPSPGITLPQIPTPPAAAAPATVPVAAPAAPPQWTQDLLTFIQNAPVVGPYVSKALVYLGVLGATLTALVAFLLAALTALSKISGLTGLATIETAVQNFKNGPIMYWLMYFSNFNAQKPVTSVAAKLAATEQKKT